MSVSPSPKIQGAKLPRRQPSFTIEDPKIQALQRKIAIATVSIPFMGTVAAIALAARNGISNIEIGLCASLYVITVLGVECGFHRLFSHRAFETSAWVRNGLAIAGSMAAQGSVLYWAASHRRHHAHSDTRNDPHSPHIREGEPTDEPLSGVRGWWHAHIGWMLTSKLTNCTLFARDILQTPALKKIHELYMPLIALGLIIPAVIGGVLHGTWMGALNGFLWGGLVRMFLVHQATWSAASFSHIFGGRPFKSDDRSANNFWCAIPSFGASWQNNHHTFPNSAYLGFEWWQIDPTAYFLNLCSALGLVWNVVKKPSEQMLSDKRV